MGNRLGASGTETVRRRADGPVSTTVVQAVADARGTAQLALPPLADVLDPDALDALYAGERPVSRVTFEYAGYSVSVAPDRTVTVTATGTAPQGPAESTTEPR